MFLVQLEVAERLAAGPGTENWGALSVFLQASYDVRRDSIVRRGAFFPQPQVDSAVVVLTPRATPIAEETDGFRALVLGAFQQRRKTLRNAWQRTLDAVTLPLAASRAGIDLDRRGETLTVEEFSRMTTEVERACASEP